jgi:hypothetical protein
MKFFTTEQKSRLIGCIISTLRFHAYSQKKQFDEGDVFLSLCFKSDNELQNIAHLSGI